MRGRRKQPAEINEMKGNPGKRAATFKRTLNADVAANEGKPVGPSQVPDFLKAPREQQLFRRVVDDYLQRRVARKTDFMAYARYAAWLHRWILCAEQLHNKATFFKSESKWGTLLRRHPLFKDMLDIERVLQSLEDRLGLNPVARQNIMRGLSALPPALGGLFGDDPPAPGTPAEEAAKPQPGDDPPAAPAAGPLGHLANATKH